jgi:hypothetical protein
VNAPASADDWADRYGELKASGPGAASAWLGIPLVVAALIGMLWSVPVPTELAERSPVLNAATLFLMATFVYYCVLSLRLAFGGLLFLLAVAWPSAWLSAAGLPLWSIASAVFAPAFCWQLLESRQATGRLHIVRNLQYLMLGPVWLLRATYRRLGVAY